MYTKVNFGFDYLYMMINAQIRSANQRDINGYNLARMFLITSWGLSTNEEATANQLINQAYSDKSLWQRNDVLPRLISYLLSDVNARMRFIIEMMIVILMDGNVTPGERQLTMELATELDFRKSEIDEMAKKAYEYASAYNWFGENFRKRSS
jgi:hypothetical protein